MADGGSASRRARVWLTDHLKRGMEALISSLWGWQVRLHVYRSLSGTGSRPDDVYLVTYPKSGTTWLQMILHQLTTDGSMDFLHIAEKSAHVEEYLMEFGGDFAAFPSPRIFKTHLPYSLIPKGRGKYIYVVRNGMSVALSFYHHYRAYHGFQGDFDAFFDLFMKGKIVYGSWFEHVRGWLENKDQMDVLYLKYEDLSKDLQGSIRQIADFCGLDIRPEDLPRILERCSFDFMRKHEHRLDVAHGWLAERKVMIESLLFESTRGVGESFLDAKQKQVFSQQLERRLAGIDLSQIHRGARP